MKDPDTEVPLSAAAITDRGLSNKRPLNEDSFLADESRRIFAVADGVGGAQAGEVASKTAVEVLDEAFRNHVNGDAEDLLEVAIQRANASIHRMSQEQSNLNMMATTVVALHLDGRTATIGHVGDSRLYRLTPDGQLHRETRDHSVVEEEVRAGRMTPDQAANHPSRNVISRALGAEAEVEVEMKTLSVEDGTAFLLCSDGITRHLPDGELRELLASRQPLEAICAEMKRRCFERGAEDNLTAVIIRVGEQAAAPDSDIYDDERTISSARISEGELMDTNTLYGAALPPSSSDGNVTTFLSGSQLSAVGREAVPSAPAPPRDSGPQTPPAAEAASSLGAAAPPIAPSAPSKSRRRIIGALAVFIMMLAIAVVAAVGAFFAGKYYERRFAPIQEKQPPAAATTSSPTGPAASQGSIDDQKREVDLDPRGALTRMQTANNGRPLDSTDPEFVYLYGRALLLSGKYSEAVIAFQRAADRLSDRPARDSLLTDARIAAAAAALMAKDSDATGRASSDLDRVVNSGQTTVSPTRPAAENDAAKEPDTRGSNPVTGTSASPPGAPQSQR